MALRNDRGEAISYECSDLIAEVENDIAEFGSHEMVAVWCCECEGVVIYTNYDFITPEQPLNEQEIEAMEHNNEWIKTMTLSALLQILKQQNAPL